MQNYELSISIVHQKRTEQGRLIVVRGKDFWRAEIWQGPWLLTRFDDTATRRSRRLAALGKIALLERLRTIAECVHGVDFDFEARR